LTREGVVFFIVTSYSNLEVIRCTIYRAQGNAVYVLEHCRASFIGCEFKENVQREITIRSADFADLEDNALSSRQSTAGLATNRDRLFIERSEFRDCGHTRVISERRKRVIKQITITSV
jgi:hypothetical protein